MTRPFRGNFGSFHCCMKTQNDECFPKSFDYTMNIPPAKSVSAGVVGGGVVYWKCVGGVTFSCSAFVLCLFCFIFPRPTLTSLRFEVGCSLQPVLCSRPWFLTCELLHHWLF